MVRQLFQLALDSWIFAVISLLVFLTVFIVVLVHTMRLRKEDVARYARMPLSGQEETDEQENNH